MKYITEIVDLKKGYDELREDRITVGMATCGISAGADKTYEKLQESLLDIMIDPVGCAGMCYAEPIVTVMKDGLLSIYGHVTEEKVPMLVQSIKNNIVCSELLLGHSLEEIDYYRKQKRILMSNCGKINPLSLHQYIANGGYGGLTRALKLSSQDVIDEVKVSGLRGRGGAGFPTG
ncbi:TPA: NADH-quinone oxidoreductase subunit F, partial [Candidatus Woesearchaeota archaeon]|nr:NADH-quinone oxidoreductase subunit F [Candidatus Woesearchaeota archaeon]